MNVMDHNMKIRCGSVQDSLELNGTEQARMKWGGQDTMGYYGEKKIDRTGSVRTGQ